MDKLLSAASEREAVDYLKFLREVKEKGGDVEVLSPQMMSLIRLAYKAGWGAGVIWTQEVHGDEALLDTALERRLSELESREAP